MLINPLETQIIHELISDLSSNLVDNNHQEQLAAEGILAYKDPFEYIQNNEENLGWITISLETASQFISSSIPALALSHSLVNNLSDYFVNGYELDNIHLKIKQKIQNKRFPEIDRYYKTFRSTNSNKIAIHSFDRYKSWLKKQIDKVNPELTIVYFDDLFNDNFYLCLIKKEKAERILANCRLLGIHIKQL
ncbi:hypothetical protein V7S76_03040 [Aquirufa sp. ROCK2-A2]